MSPIPFEHACSQSYDAPSLVEDRQSERAPCCTQAGSTVDRSRRRVSRCYWTIRAVQTEGGGRLAAPFPLISGGDYLLRLRADLLEESQRVEVLAHRLDLASFEGVEDSAGRLLQLARGRDC